MFKNRAKWRASFEPEFLASMKLAYLLRFFTSLQNRVFNFAEIEISAKLKIWRNMNFFHALILGVVQGIAEFLPVSSSGHLAVLQNVFGLQEVPPLFDVILHIPSLLAVIIFFRKKIACLFAVLFRWILRKDASQEPASSEGDAFDLLTGTEKLCRRTIIAVIATTAVTGVIGVFTSKLLPEFPVRVVCIGFLFTAALLIAQEIFSRQKILAEKNPESEKKSARERAQGISILQALAIGVAQGLGTLPGVSRSGSTISGAIFCGVPCAQAAEYSFIVSIPAILAAFVLELRDVQKMSAVGILPLVLSCVVCFLAAYASLSWLMKIIKKGRLEWFACYLIPLGILGLIFF